MSGENLNLNLYEPRKSYTPNKESKFFEKELQLKCNQEIEEKILNNKFKINILVSIICILFIIIYFSLDKKIIKLEKKNNNGNSEKSKKNLNDLYIL
jgi:hypothetical protein